MRVCAQPRAYPISGEERPGFENRIAQVLADHLGAELTFEWTRIDFTGIYESLHAGTCDVVFGVLDGAGGVLTTVPYYRAPYVFIYPAAAEFEVTSLEDPVLDELRFAVEPHSIGQLILSELGHLDRLVRVDPSDATAAGRERLETSLAAVTSGEADLTIAFGPDAAGLAESGEFIVRPVLPEFLPPLHQLYRSLTIGVRPNDEAFRDRLNIALAETWDEIQAVMDEYEVPRLSVIRPSPPATQVDRIEVGTILPMRTMRRQLTDVSAMAARIGSLVAEDLVAEGSESGVDLKILLADAPTPQAAQRAAHRLAATEKIVAFTGGVGEGQAQVLKGVAEATQTPFFNIGEDSAALRATPSPFVFHVFPDSTMILQAITDGLQDIGVERWFVLHDKSEQSAALLESFTEIAGEGQVVGSSTITSRYGPFDGALAELAATDADGVLLLLAEETQEFFLSQYQLDLPVTGFPHEVMQTRNFMIRMREVLPTSGRLWVSTWDTQVTGNGAEDFNELIVGRTGEPADSTAWTAFAAASVAHAAALASREEGVDFDEYISSPAATFELLTGEALSFDTCNQLAQPLYLLETDTEARYNQRVGVRIGLANVVSVLGPYSSKVECN